MNLFFVFILIISLIGIEFCFKKGNKDYLSKVNTSCIKGIFILIVFYSHFCQYTDVNMSKDFIMFDIRSFLGQLMVALFLFYSGYGIFESLKSKKGYIEKLPKNRIFKTWLHFAIVIFIFLIVNLLFISNPDLSIKRVLLSFFAWDSIGNSNWYIFSIICLYIITYLSFKIFNNKKDYQKGIALNYLLTIVVMMLLSIYKEDYWFNTMLCYPLGLSYSFHKDIIEEKLFNPKTFIMVLFVTVLSFLTLMKFQKTNFWYYDIYSMIFCLLIVELTVLINLKSPILKWFGDNLFWIYILQRLPMMVLNNIGYNTHPYRFALISFVITIVLTFIFKFLIKYIDKLFFKEKEKVHA